MYKKGYDMKENLSCNCCFIGLLVLYVAQPSSKIQEELPKVKKPIPTDPEPVVEQTRASRKGPKKPPLSRESNHNSNPKKKTQPPVDKNEEQDQELEEKEENISKPWMN